MSVRIRNSKRIGMVSCAEARNKNCKKMSAFDRKIPKLAKAQVPAGTHDAHSMTKPDDP